MTAVAEGSSTPAAPSWVAAVLADLAAGDPASVAGTRVGAFDELGGVDVGPEGGKVQAASGISPSGEAGSRQSEQFLYAGQYRDAESGMYFMRARYYDPATAQFLTRDPLAASTRSPYGYVHDNPLNHTDPTGKEDYNTVPSQYQGHAARCWAHNDTYTIIQLPGENGQQACNRALPNRGEVVDLNGPAAWGGNGENTGGVNYPGEVNGGAYNSGPVVNAELGTKVAWTICSGVATLALPVLELPLVVEGAIDAVDAGVEIWDWTRKQ